MEELEKTDARSGSLVTISGGSLMSLSTQSGAVVNMSGGSVLDSIYASNGVVVNISGGNFIHDDFDRSIKASAGSEINLFGTEFLIDGTRLHFLTLGEAFTLVDRGALLSGVLADGSVFDLDLNSTQPATFSDYFEPGSTLTLTLVMVPAPASSVLLGLAAVTALVRRRTV